MMMRIAVPVIAQKNFQPDYDEVKGAADQNKYLFSEVFHYIKLKQITDLCNLVLLTR